MKELSIEQKAKSYDNALREASIAYNDEDRHLKATLERIFPELKEIDSEIIRKDCIKYLDWEYQHCPLDEDKMKIEKCIAWLEKQGESVEVNPTEFDLQLNKLLKQFESLPKEEIASSLSFYLNVVQNDGTYKDEEKQGDHQKFANKEYTFKAIPRLLEMIQPTDRAKSYCKKLIDSLEQEGYITDAKIVRDYLKLMNGENVPMATMDEQKASYTTIVETGDGGINVLVTRELPTDSEQKPADKIESKFKVGDWIANDYCVGKVIALTDDAYLLDSGQGIPFSCEHNAHLWTIQDAKDGDVLVTPNQSIFIFKEIKGATVYDYCGLYFNKFCDEPLSVNGTIAKELPKDYTPATKEQRDTLMKAMADAGYTFDFEKKELKKIVHNHDWSEDDEKRAEKLHGWIDTLVNYIHNDVTVSLDIRRDRMQQVEQLKTWFKLLKDRYIWKPSDEQMNALDSTLQYSQVSHNSFECLNSLFNDLKKLKA